MSRLRLDGHMELTALRKTRGRKMIVPPVVRYMILCNDWGLDTENKNRVNIYGLLSHIYPIGETFFPLIVVVGSPKTGPDVMLVPLG